MDFLFLKSYTIVFINVVKKQCQKFSKQPVWLSYGIAWLEKEQQVNVERFFSFPGFVRTWGIFGHYFFGSSAFHSQIKIKNGYNME